MPTDSHDTVWRHHTAEIQPGVRMHSVITGPGNRTVVLLHGFPQLGGSGVTLFRHSPTQVFVWLQRTIAALGTHQNRRAATTNAPLASDLHKLLRDRLRIEGPVVLVGHDIGLMIGYLMEQYERTSSIRPADGT